MAGLERFARRWWGGELGVSGEVLGVLSAPAAWIWAGVVQARARGAATGHRVGGLRVISVGNLAVGGTGKTPLAGWVARTVRASGSRACVLVGGGGADEAPLHRVWNPDVPVWSGRDRVALATRARAEGMDLAVLDDGFQHHALARDLDVVVLSADDPDPGKVLPRGPFRESIRALERADLVIVTRRVADLARARSLADGVDRRFPGLVLGAVHLVPGAWRGIGGAPAAPRTEDVLAVCGIGRPDAFAKAVARRVTGTVELYSFPDHHAFTAEDVARIRARAAGRCIVVTEKDAVKLEAILDVDGAESVHVLSDQLVWDWGEDGVRARVETVVADARVA